jgi:Bacterial regulatory proteins, luxR family
MLVDAYGLTRRQREVLGHLLLGSPMTRLAHALGISEHTAQDHRKATLRKDVRLEPIRAIGAPPIRAVRPAGLERHGAEPLRGFLEAAPAGT